MMDQEPTDSELLEFLLGQMQGGSPHMDSTFFWTLPLRVTRHRARTAREAIIASYRQYLQWVKEAKERNHD